MTRHRIVLLALILGALLSGAGAAEAAWQNFRAPSELPGDGVQALRLRPDGSLEVVTNGGLARFDGLAWSAIPWRDVPSLQGQYVSSAYFDRAGRLWLGTSSGIVIFDGTAWERFDPPGAPDLRNAYSVFEDRGGTLWIGHGVDVSRYEAGVWTTEPLNEISPELGFSSVACFAETRSGDLLLGCEDRVLRRSAGQWQLLRSWPVYPDGNPEGGISAILEDEAGDLWFAASGGVYRVRGSEWTWITSAEGLAPGGVSAMLQDRSGTYWFGTATGLSRFDGALWRTFTTADGMPGMSVSALLEDEGGALWVGSFGLSRFDKVTEDAIRPPDPSGNGPASWIVEDRRHAMWFATRAGASRLDAAGWRTYTWADSLVSDYVLAILEDHDGNLWFGTIRGISRFDGTRWTSYRRADGLADETTYVLFETVDGEIWAGGSDGASRFDGTRWTPVTAASTGDGLRTDVRAIAQDAEGALWFGGCCGASRLKDGQWQTFGRPDLVDLPVTSMARDSSDALWFGTFGGASRFDGSNWTQFTAANTSGGLFVDDVRALTVERGGAVLFGHSTGDVSRFDGERWTRYPTAGQSNGGRVTCLLEGHSGALWIGFDSFGALRIDPDQVAPWTIALNVPGAVTTDPRPVLTAGVALQSLDGVTFSYRVDPVVANSPWTEWTTSTLVPPRLFSDGAHVVEIRSRDARGNIDPVPARVEFEVDATPPLPLLTLPFAGQVVRDSLLITGSADDARFESYTVELQLPDGTWAAIADRIPQRVPLGVLARLPLSGDDRPDGTYRIRLSVRDTLGLNGSVVQSFTLDNRFPRHEETGESRILAAQGGSVYTLGGEGRIYVPPGALTVDTEVRLALGARAGDYVVGWEGGALRKPAILDLAVDPALAEAGEVLAVHEWSGEDSIPLGGTFVPGTRRIQVEIREPGTYFVASRTAAAEPGQPASGDVRVAPRVASRARMAAAPLVAIAFSLGQPGPVDVSIHNRAGRLVRRLAQGRMLAAGSNVLDWDLRDETGEAVAEGAYVVAISAGGERRTAVLAVTP